MDYFLFTASNNINYYGPYEWGPYNVAALICHFYGKDVLAFDSTEEFDEFHEKLLKESDSWDEQEFFFWIGIVGDGINFAWSVSGKPIIPSLWNEDSLSGVHNCVSVSNRNYGLYQRSCSDEALIICQDRVKPKSCCKKKNIFLNIKQQNF